MVTAHRPTQKACKQTRRASLRRVNAEKVVRKCGFAREPFAGCKHNYSAEFNVLVLVRVLLQPHLSCSSACARSEVSLASASNLSRTCHLRLPTCARSEIAFEGPVTMMSRQSTEAGLRGLPVFGEPANRYWHNENDDRIVSGRQWPVLSPILPLCSHASLLRPLVSQRLHISKNNGTMWGLASRDDPHIVTNTCKPLDRLIVTSNADRDPYKVLVLLSRTLLLLDCCKIVLAVASKGFSITEHQNG